MSASSVERRLGALLTSLAFLLYPVLLWRGWGRWNDVQVDFGRELYVPWRLMEGDWLYRDIAYFNGPLSPYWNALWFSVAGDSLATLMIVNAVITLLFAVLLHRILTEVSGPIAAGASVLFFFPVFACGHFPGIGNYNFMTPYSHEITHGLFLGLAAFRVALTGRKEGQLLRSAASGALLGLCFLTKAEVFLAAFGAIGWLYLLSYATDPRGYWKRVGTFLVSALVAPLIAFLVLAPGIGSGPALTGVLGSWTGIFGSSTANGLFYRRVSGLERFGLNLGELATNFGWLLLLFGPAALFDRLLSSRPSSTRWIVGTLYACALIVFFVSSAWGPAEWMVSLRSLPLIALLAVLVAAFLAWRAESIERPLWAARSAFAVFSFLMMLKVILFLILAHYGFALAVCGVALLLSILTEWIPHSKLLKGSDGAVLRCAALTWLLATSIGLWSLTEQSFAEKNVAVGEGRDRFYACANLGADIRGEGVRQVLEKIKALTSPSQSILVLPEGIMVNYLARRKSPTRYINFMPPELDLFGERNILQALRKAPDPAAVILIHKDTSEYGVPFFGTDYGLLIMNWARRRYQPDWRFAQPPLEPSTGRGFGIGFLGPR